MKNPFRSVRIFAGEMVAELKKATWPTRTELRDSTLVVIVAVIASVASAVLVKLLDKLRKKDAETEAEGWVVINSLRGGAAG